MKTVLNKTKLKNQKQTVLNFLSVSSALAVAGCGGGQVVPENTSTENLNGENFFGSAIADIIRGTDLNDSIYSSSGDDRIFAQGGNDLIYSQNGYDVVYAGSGDDTIYISDFDELIDGGTGYDTIILEPSLGFQAINVNFETGQLSESNLQTANAISISNIERIISNLSSDILLTGIDAVDSITTLSGNDTIFTGSQTSVIATGGGTDVVTLNGNGHTVSLGKGDDTLTFSDFFNSANGGDETDTLFFKTQDIDGQITVNLSENSIKFNGLHKSSITSFESVIIEGPTAIELIGSSQNEHLAGGSGNDLIKGNGGTDRVSGGGGSDTFIMSDNAFITIDDFEFGLGGDVLGNIAEQNSTTVISNIKSIDLSGGGQTSIETPNHILIDTSQIDISNENELLALLNSSNGVKPLTSNSFLNAEFFILWYHNESATIKVSKVSDTNFDNNLDQAEAVAELLSLEKTALSEFIIDNFLIA